MNNIKENKKIRKRRGITTLELVLALSLTVVVMTLGIQLFSLTVSGLNFTVNETKMQTDARIFATEVNNHVRYSKAVFTIPQSSFREDNLTKDWNYMGVMENVTVPADRSHTGISFKARKALVHIIAQDKAGKPAKQPEDNLITSGGATFVQRILGYSYVDDKTGKEIEYSLVFDKKNPSDADQKLSYTFKAQLIPASGKKADYLGFETALESLNSLQVIHKGSKTNPSVAIAYRSGNKDLVVGHVSMVIDISGSMGWTMAGRGRPKPGESRIEILKDKGQVFIDKMSENENVDIGLFPFAGSVDLRMYKGNHTDENIFKSASHNKEELKKRIKDLSHGGGTNTGDGLRYSYFRLKDHNATVTPPQKPVNYLILLVDGDSNLYSYTEPSRTKRYFFMDDGISGYKISHQDFYNGGYYVEEIAKLYDKNTKVFFIVFSSDVSTKGVNAIKKAFSLDDKHLFMATDAKKLNEAFDMIQEEIKRDLWYLNGPKL
ncbi:MAG: vWA domain-containing protein [Filifactor alocis]|nr:vWA domain-containing protein [Filifactor alocis]